MSDSRLLPADDLAGEEAEERGEGAGRAEEPGRETGVETGLLGEEVDPEAAAIEPAMRFGVGGGLA